MQNATHLGPTDSELSEALISGLSEAEAAAMYQVSCEEVRMARRRVLIAREALGPVMAEWLTLAESFRVVARQALEAHQKALVQVEETVKVIKGGKHSEPLEETVIKTRAPDPRFLRMALTALIELRKLEERRDKSEREAQREDRQVREQRKEQGPARQPGETPKEAQSNGQSARQPAPSAALPARQPTSNNSGNKVPAVSPPQAANPATSAKPPKNGRGDPVSGPTVPAERAAGNQSTSQPPALTAG